MMERPIKYKNFLIEQRYKLKILICLVRGLSRWSLLMIVLHHYGGNDVRPSVDWRSLKSVDFVCIYEWWVGS